MHSNNPKNRLAIATGALLLGACGHSAPPSVTLSAATPSATTATTATPATASDPIMQQAATDLKAVQAVKSEWLFIDKASGNEAQTLSQFMKIAQQHAADGNLKEAHRLAVLISKYAVLGIAQAAKQQGATPFYPN